MHITYDFWRGADEPREQAWQRVVRIALTPPLSSYIGARVLEMTSKWMFRVTTPMVVWQLTHDERMIANALVCLLLPGLVMELVGGIVADRYDRRVVMVVSCLGSFVCNLTIALLALAGLLTIPVLLVLTAFYGGINAMSQASSKTIVTAYVRKEDLATAVSLNTVVFNLAAFIGPVVAAGLIFSFGNAAAYFASALLTLVFIVLLLRIPPPVRESESQHVGFVTALRDGFQHVITQRLLLFLFLMHVGSIALSRPFVEFVPAIAHHALGGGVRETGYLLSAFGVGSIIGGLWLAGCDANRKRLAGVALGAMPLFAAALLGITLATSLWLMMLFSAMAGFGMITRGGAIQSLLQLESHPAYRGRVMALHGVTFEFGCIVGALSIGQLAKATTLPMALSLCVFLLVALWLALKGPLADAAAAQEAKLTAH